MEPEKLDELSQAVSLFDLKQNVSNWNVYGYFNWEDFEKQAYLLKKKMWSMDPLTNRYKMYTTEYDDNLPAKCITIPWTVLVNNHASCQKIMYQQNLRFNFKIGVCPKVVIVYMNNKFEDFKDDIFIMIHNLYRAQVRSNI